MSAVLAERSAPVPARRVLVVDDDRAMVGMISLLLGEAGYGVITAYDGEAALRRARDEKPDLVILDLRLPRLGGDVVVRRITAEGPIPVIMLTGQNDADEKARLLDLGADDYLTKPVGRTELLARVRAVLRRRGPVRSATPSHVALDGLEVDAIRYVATADGRDLRLTVLELRLLARLAADAGAVATAPELLGAGWPDARDPDPAWLRGPLHRLRAKLRDASARFAIGNARGVGYRLVSLARATAGNVKANSDPSASGRA